MYYEEGYMAINKETRYKAISWNIYRFFQPATFQPTPKAEVEESPLPTPMDRYVPRLVLVPRGYK